MAPVSTLLQLVPPSGERNTATLVPANNTVEFTPPFTGRSTRIRENATAPPLENRNVLAPNVVQLEPPSVDRSRPQPLEFWLYSPVPA